MLHRPNSGEFGRDPTRHTRPEDEEERFKSERERKDAEMACRLQEEEEEEEATARALILSRTNDPERPEGTSAREGGRAPDAAPSERRTPEHPLAHSPGRGARAPDDAVESAPSLASAATGAGAGSRGGSKASRAGATAAAAAVAGVSAGAGARTRPEHYDEDNEGERNEPRRCFKFAIAVPKVIWMEAQKVDLAEINRLRSAEGLVIELSPGAGTCAVQYWKYSSARI